MRKLKIYLDTSVISYLDQHDAAERMAETLDFWQEVKYGKYDIYVSDVTITEISKCNEQKKATLEKYLSEINFTVVPIDEEMEVLAEQIISQGILTQKSHDDCMHISAAVIYDCDIIASWNFKHIVNVKTINGVRAINILNGYRPIDIYTPAMLTEGRENNE